MIHFNILNYFYYTLCMIFLAAHCVTNSETGKAYFTRYYRVAAGKYYYMYGDSRDFDTAQYVQVAEIEISNKYSGVVQNFRGDIALLRLKTAFGVSKLVQPICYLNLPESIPKTLGLVTGWGCTTSSENSSDVLKSNKVPYTEEDECKRDLDEEFSQKYLTSDKFCAGFYNGSKTICKGVRGAGLVFENPNYKHRYFIHGIVSVCQHLPESQETHCNIQGGALFTNVYIYNDWIKLTLARWERKMKYR